MRNTLLSLLVTLSTFSLSAQDHYQAVFDAMRPTRTLLDFMVNAQFVEDEKGALIKSIQQLEKEGTKLNQVASDSIRVGIDYALITPASALTHYQEVSGQTWLDVVDGISKAEMMENYKRASKAIGLRTNMTIRMGQVYLKPKADRLTGLGALFYTGRNVFNIGIGLPFAIPESIDELTQDQRDRILDELQNLRQMVEIIVKNYVHPSEMALYPTFNRQLTSTQRLYGLTQFWTEVKYNFAFFDQVPKLNWDQKLLEYLPLIEKEQSNESYYKNMQRLCATLQDGHTNIYVPAYVRNAYDSPALQLKNIQQKAIVTNTTDELIDQVPLGSEILSVDDVLTQKYLETEIFPYISSSTDYILYDFGIRDLLDGASGTIVNIKYQKPDQSIHELTLPRNFSQTGATWIKEREPWQWTNFKMLENDIAYVALNSFSSEKVVEEFEQYLDTLKNSKAVIIDLRKNGGGSSSNGYSILQYFANKAFLGSSWKTREHRPAFKAWGSFYANYQNDDNEWSDWQKQAVKYYKGNVWHESAPDTIQPHESIYFDMPMIVLIGHNTASAAEDFLIALDNLGHATIVGQNTFGSTGQPLSFKLPGGGSARVCTKKDTYPDGREFVGYGVKPDIYVEYTLEDLLKNNDPDLEKALEILKTD